MGGDPIRTDYMEIDEFRKRALAATARGDRPMPRKVLILNVPYNSDFNVFAANVAYAIRGEVVYRSDGGVFARGFVRASGDLQKIHSFFRDPKSRPGSTVQIVGYLWRRKDTAASMHWVMSIRFKLPSITFTQDEAENVKGRSDVVKGLEKHLVQDILDDATTATEGSGWNLPNKWGADRIKRVRDWIHLATWTGYPALLNLWYYDRRAVFLYVQLKVSLDHRWMPDTKGMTVATAGKLPFDGDNGPPEHLPWRHYVFREILDQCRGKTKDACYDIVARGLSDAEDAILRTFADVQHEIQRATQYQSAVQPVSGGVTGTASGELGQEANEFLAHLQSLSNDPSTLYHAYTKNTQATPGLWGTY